LEAAGLKIDLGLGHARDPPCPRRLVAALCAALISGFARCDPGCPRTAKAGRGAGKAARILRFSRKALFSWDFGAGGLNHNQKLRPAAKDQPLLLGCLCECPARRSLTIVARSARTMQINRRRGGHLEAQ